jgi:hypothetical protein
MAEVYTNPIRCPLAWKEGGQRGKKERNIKHTVVPNVASWNDDGFH